MFSEKKIGVTIF